MQTNHFILNRRYIRALRAMSRYSLRFDKEGSRRFGLYHIVAERIFGRLYWDEQKGGQ